LIRKNTCELGDGRTLEQWEQQSLVFFNLLLMEVIPREELLKKAILIAKRNDSD